MKKITAQLQGPVGTPFEEGEFLVLIELVEEFPVKPPKGRFLTKIFHPNISKTGEICVNTLKKDWKSTYGITHILQVIRCLLIAPNPESALNEEAGRLFQEDYEKYAAKAKMLSSIHAKPKKKQEELTASSTPVKASNNATVNCKDCVNSSPIISNTTNSAVDENNDTSLSKSKFGKTSNENQNLNQIEDSEKKKNKPMAILKNSERVNEKKKTLKRL